MLASSTIVSGDKGRNHRPWLTSGVGRAYGGGMAKIAFILLYPRTPTANHGQGPAADRPGRSRLRSISTANVCRTPPIPRSCKRCRDNPQVVFARDASVCGWGEWEALLVERRSRPFRAAAAAFPEGEPLLPHLGATVPTKSVALDAGFLDDPTAMHRDFDFFASDGFKRPAFAGASRLPPCSTMRSRSGCFWAPSTAERSS